MRSRTRITLGCLLCLVLIPGASAQDKASAPTPPEAPLYQPDSAAAAAPVETGQTMTPDTRPITGAQLLTLGGSGLPSHLSPKLHFGQTFDSNPNTTGADSGISALTSVSGELELQRQSRTQELMVRYSGGGLFYVHQSGNTTQQQPSNSTFQRLGISQRLTVDRWSLLASDEVGYLSAATLGGGMASGLAVLGPAANVGVGSLAGLNPNFLPAQNLVEQVGSEISNSVVLEADYRIGARSSLSVTGNYGLLRSPDGNLIESNQEGVSFGYNHTFTARDTIGISYGFMQFNYPGTGGRLRDHTGQLMYGRRITGRLSLQLAGGGGVTDTSIGGLTQNLFLWNAQASVHYVFRRSDLVASYSRATNSGSGVLLGANSDVVSASVSRTFLRRWLTSTTVGYSRNSALTSGSTFSTYFVTSGVRRDIGRYTGVFANYSFQRQTGISSCPTCGNDSVRHTATIGFDWSFRPIRLE
jgi:hypothetical protein